MTFCLPKFAADIFKTKLVSGEIDPAKLTEMSSEERRAFFKDFLGEENAKQVNTLFESKLLLKNQQAGIINWAKSVVGMKPEVLRDILTKVEKMTEVLSPKNEKAFLSDLAEKKLGIGVSVEEAGHIVDLAKRVADAKAGIENGGERIDYGRAKVAFDNYIKELKLDAAKKTMGDRVMHPLDTISELGAQAKSIKASFDLSAIFRQGFRPMLTHPSVWFKNTIGAFEDAAKTLGGKQVMDEVNADLQSRENATNGYYRKAKLAIGSPEEAFPSSLPEKIPFLGRVYTASETAFTAFQYKMRADVFDKYIEIAKKSGIDPSDTKQLESIGKLVNSLTERGNLGKLEPVANVVNNIFFSPRAIKSHIDFLTAHVFDGDMTSFAKKQAAINLVKVISGTAAILTIANILRPGSAELDPRSSDFGAIRIGDTRFNVTGGVNSIVTLAAREALQSTKSSTTHKITPINSGKFGAQTGQDVIVNFFTNKVSPATSVVKDLINQKDFNGNKPTLLNEANNLLTPLTITTAMEAMNDPKAANVLLTVIADGLGISANTYGAPKKKH